MRSVGGIRGFELLGMVVLDPGGLVFRRGWISGGDGVLDRRDGGIGGDGRSSLFLRFSRCFVLSSSTACLVSLNNVLLSSD